tara:strand:+ start:3689 stop:4696 length:1008 start_codon:yes stop_codon:yes gene_type:complete
MGRPRKTNIHLPPKVYQDKKSGMYYFVDANNKYHQLGRELSGAISQYYKLMPHHERLTSMADLIDRYMIELSPLKAPTTHSDEFKSARQLRHRLGDLYVTEVSSVDVARYYTLRSEEAPVRANREMSLLSAMFKQAPFWGLPVNNPAASIRRKSEFPAKAAKKLERYISDEQILTFKKFTPIWLSRYIDLKMTLGLRQSAMLKLNRTMIRESCFFVNDISKNGGALMFEWTPTLRAVINQIVETMDSNTEFFFTSKTGKPHNAESFSSAWQRAMQRALKQGLEKRFAERYIRNKVVTDCNDLVKASKTVGHTNTSVTKQHYSMLGTRVEPFEKRI